MSYLSNNCPEMCLDTCGRLTSEEKQCQIRPAFSVGVVFVLSINSFTRGFWTVDSNSKGLS
jgi:hypothetical protein